MSYRPHLLPKVRSDALMDAIGGKLNGVKQKECMPCTMRIAGLVGLRCADRETVVGCHSGSLGKGISTKVSDLTVVAGCMVCHGLWDRAWQNWEMLYRNPDLKWQMYQRVLSATHETQAMLVADGILTIKGAIII